MSSATSVLTSTQRENHSVLPVSVHGIKEIERPGTEERPSIVDLGERTANLKTFTPNEGAFAVSSGNQSSQAEAHQFNAITPQMRRKEKVILAAMCFPLFLAGWNDGTIGPLLPRIQGVYGV